MYDLVPCSCCPVTPGVMSLIKNTIFSPFGRLESPSRCWWLLSLGLSTPKLNLSMYLSYPYPVGGAKGLKGFLITLQPFDEVSNPFHSSPILVT